MRTLALITLILCSPLMIIIAICVYFDSGPEIIFKQTRVGLNKAIFTIYKFKTMENDKVTFVGKVLRKLGLDEMPQLVNIIKGDMAFIGPRPLTEQDINRLGWNSSDYEKRWDVKPGITGKAQLNKVCDAKLSMENDMWYASNKSFSVDLSILLQSLKVPFKGKRTK